MNRSAIQPEPRIPHRKICASAAASIRDPGNDIGNDIECIKNLMVAAIASPLTPYANLLVVLTRIIFIRLVVVSLTTPYVSERRLGDMPDIWYGPLSYKAPLRKRNL